MHFSEPITFHFIFLLQKMRFNQSVTTESEKNINNLFFKITQLRFLFIKKGLAREQKQQQAECRTSEAHCNRSLD